MKWRYRIVSNATGYIAYIEARSRKEAIEIYRNVHGVSLDWMAKHAKVTNCGRAD